MRKLCSLIAALAIISSVSSQSPEKMSYQAVIRNSNNDLVSSVAVSMRISLLQGSADGTMVYSETQTPETNSNGLVSIEIGTGTTSDDFSSINWTGGPYFLKTETDLNGGSNYTITGTSQLLSVPYALYSKTAGNVFSGNYNDLINQPILFDGTWNNLTGKPTFATVAASGSYNDLIDTPTILGSQWTNSGSDIYYNDGNVGIGTSNPLTYIHAHGSPVTSRGQISLSAPSGEGTFISFYDADIFKAYLWYNVDDEDLRLQNYTTGNLNLNPYGGNVGIGTNTPGTTLEVAGQIRITGGSPAAGEVLTSDGTGLASWEPSAGPSEHYLGEFFGGGIVFWLDETGQHGLICAKEDQSTGVRWYAGTLGETQAKGDGPFSGEANTAIIIAAQVAIGDDGSTYAARICNEVLITEGGKTYGDWYLPSKEELNLMYQNRTTIDATATSNGGNAFASASYWSSTEISNLYAWFHFFGRGDQGGHEKDDVEVAPYVRAIRAF